MKSKLKTLMDMDIDLGLSKGNHVLYLGASHGVTAKIISKIVGPKGFVYCLEISPTVMKKLLPICIDNENMAPLLYDANKVEEYEKKIGLVDFIYQDLAQRNQVDIFHKNAERFLKQNGSFILIIKTKSIDAVMPEKMIMEHVMKKLEIYSTRIVNLNATHKGHYAVIGKKS